MSLLETTPIVQNEAEADALLEKINSPTQEAAPTENAAQPSAETTPGETPNPAKEAVQQEQMRKLVWKGKELSVPESKYTAFAQQGYDYNEKMRALNADRAAIEARKTEYETKFKDMEKRVQEYREVEEYLKKDPEWWNHVRESYQNRMKEKGSVSHDPVIQKLSEELSGIKEFVSSQKERELQAKRIEEDTALDQEITTFKEQNNSFDWSTLDENGNDLEKRIGLHMLENGIKSFRAAARDYLFDEYVKRHEVKAKETLGKEIQKVSKLGLGPVRTESRPKVSKPQSVRNKSYDELAQEALKELRG